MERVPLAVAMPGDAATQTGGPLWQGESLEGKRILLYAEQGLGDTFHFLRYAGVLKKRGATVIIHGPPALTAFLSRHPDIDTWIPQSLTVDVPFDCHCSLIDVADILKTDLTNIPSEVPYIQPANYLVDYWRSWFQKEPTGRRIGLVWQGNRDHQADAFRSFPMDTYLPLADLPQLVLYSLQFGFGKEQVAHWKGKEPCARLARRG